MAVTADQDFDLVVVGSGAGGLTAAIRASVLGLRVCLVEALDLLGGATAFSGGQVWVGANHVMAGAGLEDDLDEVAVYVRAIVDERGGIEAPVSDQWIRTAPEVARFLDSVGAMRWAMIPDYPDYYYPATPGSKATGRYLTAAPISGAELGQWRAKLLVGPHFPVGITYGELFELGTDRTKLEALLRDRRQADMLTFGTGVAAHLVAAAARLRVPVKLEHRATELLVEGGRVSGVRCESPHGDVLLKGQVLLATGTYDWDAGLVARYSWLEPADTGSVAPPTLRGDAIRLSESVGADVVAIPADAAPHIPGLRFPITSAYDAGYRSLANVSLPNCFLVDRTGRRFCDDSFYRPVTRAVLGDRDSSGGFAHLPFFLIWDEQHHQRYGLGPIAPGADYPPALGVAKANTLHELAGSLGIDPAGLESTAAAFNADAADGIDSRYQRGQNQTIQRFRGDADHKPSPILGPVEKPPFFGVRMLLLGTAIGAAGVHAGLDGRVLRPDGTAIDGLYAAGAATALTTSGTGYNSGFSISRAITFGYLAASDVAARATRGAENRV